MFTEVRFLDFQTFCIKLTLYHSLSVSQRFDSFPLSDTIFAPFEARSLWDLLSSQLCKNSSGEMEAPHLSTEEAEVLRSLPVHRNIFNHMISVHPDVHYFLGTDPLLQVEEEECLDSPQNESEKLLYSSLSIKHLSNEDILVKLALPRFDTFSEETKDNLLTYILVRTV